MPTVKLNQIIAVEKGLKERSHKEITAIYQGLGKTEPMQGISRTYAPLTDDGEKLPPENKYVQVKVTDLLSRLRKLMSEIADVTYTKDNGNTIARADIVVGDRVIAKDVPPTYLLYLEKTLTDLRTVLGSLPKLDPAEKWIWNSQQGFYESVPSQTARTKKTQAFVVVEGSGVPDKGVAPQVREITNDVLAGYWTMTKFSAAMEPTVIASLAERTEALLKAVKFAREAANGAEVPQVTIADSIFGYIFENDLPA
jgi:hypothetical protein